jgi:hypothetical protein
METFFMMMNKALPILDPRGFTTTAVVYKTIHLSLVRRYHP